MCRLNKSLYRLKQAPKNWNEKFSFFLKSLGFRERDDETCVYYSHDKRMIICLHVDDGLVAGTNKSEIAGVISLLHEKFGITLDMADGNCLSYLGTKIENKRNEIFVS